MVWTLFVLDFDGTYCYAHPDSIAVQPFVYLIPLNRQRDVEFYAGQASRIFNQEDYEYNYDYTMPNLFEELCEQNGIKVKLVGDIDLTFGERQVDYLADYIPREIV